MCGIVKRQVLAGSIITGCLEGWGAESRSSSATMMTSTRASLYLENEIGGRPDRTLRGNRYVLHPRQQDLALVSNIAHKLGIPNHISCDVLVWYRKFRKEQKLKLTKAKCLVLAFYGVCRNRGQPLDEQRLLEVVRMELNVVNACSFLKVMMEASGCLDDGEMVLERMGFLDLGRTDCNAGKGGALASSVRQRKQFSLGSELSLVNEQYDSGVAAKIAAEARNILPVISRTEKNPARASRIAVKVAKRRYGQK